ncbi:MAG: GNAT family N-acetyltransferase [Cyclobacteriaceae bacterium]
MDFKIVKVTNDLLRKKLFDIRREVFVVEQEVSPEEEFDEFEDSSHHFLAMDENENPVGASRWRSTEKGVKLERFAVKKNMRGKGLGSAIVEETLKDISGHVPIGTYLYMHAQLDAVPLYEKYGFLKKGEQFEECEIQHYFMWKLS